MIGKTDSNQDETLPWHPFPWQGVSDLSLLQSYMYLEWRLHEMEGLGSAQVPRELDVLFLHPNPLGP